MTHSRTVLVSLVMAQVLFLQTLAVQAGAQETPKDPPATTTTPDVKNTLEDIVVLKTGRKIRGMILDSDPNGSVTILNGENQKLKFAMNEVSFAGSFNKWKASQEPPASKKEESPKPTKQTQPPSDKTDEGVTVELDGSFDGKPLTFFKFAGTTGGLIQTTSTSSNGSSSSSLSPIALKSFSTICVAPCTQTWVPGTYRLGLGIDQGGAAEGNSVAITEPSKVKGVYNSKAGTRRAGWIVMISSFAFIGFGSVAAFTFLAHEECHPPIGNFLPERCDKNMNFSALMVFLGIGFAGTLAGGIMAQISDKVHFEVTPLNTASWQKSDKLASSTQASQLLPQGLMLRGYFL
jgi:hypothetical protein